MWGCTVTARPRLSVLRRHGGTACRRKIGPEQYRNPSRVVTRLTGEPEGHGERDTEERADQPEQVSPKDHRYKHNQRREAKPVPHDPRFNYVADDDADDQISGGSKSGIAGSQ